MDLAMEGLIFRGVYIRNSLGVYSEYMVGLYTVGLYWWGRGGYIWRFMIHASGKY
jgi:hypothetical protein